MSPESMKLYEEFFSESEQEASMEEKPDQAVKSEKKPKVEYPLEVADYFNGFVGPALGAEGEMKPDTFVHMKTFLKGWAKHHYKKHTNTSLRSRWRSSATPPTRSSTSMP